MKATVFATDVGYGNTKSAFARGAEIGLQMFPSLAPPATNSTLSQHGGGYLKARDVITVTVDGSRYEVGPDITLTTAYGDTGRTLSEDFVTTPNYTALLAGSLQYAGVTEVDRLVLGLPVHTTPKYSDYLRDRYTGELEFGDMRIVVRNVMPLPQPLGALVSFSQYGGDQFDPRNSHLIVDVGYFTTDWVVARGFTMDDSRSGGVPGGAAKIYQQMAALIGKAEGEAVSGIERIDECLRENLPMLFYGKDLDLRPYFEEARSLCHATVKEMQSRVGRAEDIRSIVLTGGGAAIYAPFIKAAFPRTTVHMMESPCYANVRGFYLIGSAHQARGGGR